MIKSNKKSILENIVNGAKNIKEKVRNSKNRLAQYFLTEYTEPENSNYNKYDNKIARLNEINKTLDLIEQYSNYYDNYDDYFNQFNTQSALSLARDIYNKKIGSLEYK